MEDLTIRKATEEDVPTLGHVLARAFEDDPFLRFLMHKDDQRQRYGHLFHEVALRRIGLPQGEVYTTSELRGAALWTPPGAWKMGAWQQLGMLPTFVRCTGLARMLKVVLGTHVVLRRHPLPPHYYLFILGVDPSSQGRGIGRALLRPILDRCDRERAPAYLETAKESNIAFYQACGFRVTGEVGVPYGGPRVWLMWRAPGS